MMSTPVTKANVLVILDDFWKHQEKFVVKERPAEPGSQLVHIPVAVGINKAIARAVHEAIADKLGIELDYVSSGNAGINYWVRMEQNVESVKTKFLKAAKEARGLEDIEPFRETVSAIVAENKEQKIAASARG